MKHLRNLYLFIWFHVLLSTKREANSINEKQRMALQKKNHFPKGHEHMSKMDPHNPFLTSKTHI